MNCNISCGLSILALCICAAICRSQESSKASLADVARYLQTISKYESIAYKCELRQTPIPDCDAPIVERLQVRARFNIRYDFRRQDYHCEKEYSIRGKQMIFRQVTSYVGDEQRGYEDDHAPGPKQQPNISQGNGVIEPIGDRDRDSMFGGAQIVMGASITGVMGKKIDLSALFERLPVETSERNLIIRNVFQWTDPRFGAYTLEVQLDPTHGHLPMRLRFLDENYVQKTVTEKKRFEIDRFYREPKTGLWVPVDYKTFDEGKFGIRVVVDPSSIVLNLNPPSESYKVQFPKDKPYVNQYTRQLMLNGKMLEQYEPLSQPFSDAIETMVRYGGWVALLVGISMLVGYLYYKRRGVALRPKKSAKNSAFTVIELLVSIAVVGVIASILLPAVMMARESARLAQCLANIRQVGLGWTELRGFIRSDLEPVRNVPIRSVGTVTRYIGSLNGRVIGYLALFDEYFQPITEETSFVLSNKLINVSNTHRGPFSYHRGVVPVAFADAHTGTISTEVDNQVLMNLATLAADAL